VTAHVHRDGPQITVHDDNGREVALLSQGHTLHIRTRGETPQLTPCWATRWVSTAWRGNDVAGDDVHRAAEQAADSWCATTI